MRKIQMVDLHTQYLAIQSHIQEAIMACLEKGDFINGSYTKSFQAALAQYNESKYCIPCGNGTDALQIALMSANLKQGDEIIVPAFTYVATAEVIALLGFKPVLIEVDPHTFNLDPQYLESCLTPRTKAIIPVHLFGQSSDMEPIMTFAAKHNLLVIEDNAQSIGALYTFADGSQKRTGSIGHIGCTSFYPSKNLGAYGDGGAIFAQDETLGQRLQMIANHGQAQKYYHECIGVNSRLDNIQAAILSIKLPYLNEYIAARQKAAAFYDNALAQIEGIQIPVRQQNSTHVFHQYTIKVEASKRDALKTYLQTQGIPSMIYYPLPLYAQKAFAHFWEDKNALLAQLPHTQNLCNTVLSLPMHTALDENQQSYICEHIAKFLLA